MTGEGLQVAFCSLDAAKYACLHWHYARRFPTHKKVAIGVWEGGEFKGAIMFGHGATPHLGDAYGLKMQEVAELTRIALRGHEHPLSQILGRAIALFRKHSPGTRLLVSFADPGQNHHGGIYQATNWLYVGRSTAVRQYYFRGSWRNDRNVMEYLKKHPGMRDNLPTRKVEGKHKYLMPLDKRIRKRVEPYAKPYPKPDQENDKEVKHG